jgi:hypothetical protein
VKGRISVAIGLNDLLLAGLLHAEDELLWDSRSQMETHRAVVTQTGQIRTSDGKLHKTPSGALRHLNGNKPVDGWNAWKAAKSRESLATLRSKLNG